VCLRAKVCVGGADVLVCARVCVCACFFFFAADILRDLGVFSLLRVSPETSEHGIVGDAPSAGGGSAGAGAGDSVPKMGSIPAPERPVILDLLDLELVSAASSSSSSCHCACIHRVLPSPPMDASSMDRSCLCRGCPV
jgi:hypothetical protein